MKTIVKLVLILMFLVTCATIAMIYNFFNVSSNLTNLSENEEYVAKLLDRVNYNSEWDSSEQYRITPFLAKGQLILDRNDITLITQCSHQHLFSLLKLVDVWQGPLSISLFCKASNVIQVVTLVAKLRVCFQNVASYVTFHLVTYEGSGNLKFSAMNQFDCSTFDAEKESIRDSRNYDLSVPYPVNTMRNVARRGTSTKYFLLIDIDMLPNLGLRQSFLEFIKRYNLDNNTVYIVPAFELEEGIPVPDTRQHLKILVDRAVMRPFYAELCPKCHDCVDYSTWLNLPNTTGLINAYRTSWSDPCEPFYIARATVPLYDEAFKQYGFNRISQVCELHVAGFSFSVLDNAFLTHNGMKTKDSFHKKKEMEQELNRKRFREFKQNLKYKYPTSVRSC